MFCVTKIISNIFICTIVITLANIVQCQPKLDGRIVGGFPIDIKDVPYQVLIRGPGYFCGGMLLSKDWVLTVAHCARIQGTQYKVYMGSSHNRGALTVEVAEVHPHPKYKKPSYDISLLKLKDYNITKDAVIGFPTLPEQNETIPDGTMLRVSGWGISHNSSDDNRLLRAVYVPKMTTEECKKIFGRRFKEDRMICAGFKEGGKDACLGDSGGPLAWGHKVVGTVSFRLDRCALPNRPTGYTKIAAVRDWIREVSGL